MTAPRVSEMPLQLEPVEPDPFIEARSRSSAGRPPLTEREKRERRVELVRRMMRVYGGDAPLTREAIRNGWPAGRTERA